MQSNGETLEFLIQHVALSEALDFVQMRDAVRAIPDTAPVHDTTPCGPPWAMSDGAGAP